MPLIRSPFTDVFGIFGYSQSYPKCRDFELNMVECLEAYGAYKGKTQCADEIDDYKECMFSLKQILRVQAMKNERELQIKAGELSPKEKVPPPKLDSYQTFPNM